METEGQPYSGSFADKTEDFQVLCLEVLRLFKESEDVLRAGRNTLRNIDFGGRVCTVKAFRVPSFPQNVSYGLLAKSKAKKSYDNAFSLLDRGLLTPKPIGYFERRSGGKLKESYYLCEYLSDVQTLDQMWKAGDLLDESVMESFAEYCYAMHHKGVLHRDFNPKNILVIDRDGTREFSIVDINRITWYSSLSLPRAMYSMSRLPFKGETMDLLVYHYANISGTSVEECQRLLNRFTRKTERYFENKKRLRKIFPKK